MIARRLRITGLVQGVNYRASFAAQARQCELAGWVRNRHDGSVEAVIVGPAPNVERTLDWARRGPPAARVAQVLVEDYAGPAPSGFSVLPDA